MAKFQIVCTDLLPVSGPRPHQHIVAVGVDTDNDGVADDKHTLEKVINNIHINRDIYFTVGNVSKKTAVVEVARCIHCSHQIIKTRPDDTRDNNLEQIRTCNWRAA